MIAALYVQTRGVYFNLPGVDPWDEHRDARLYAGPHSVVAHPPCGRWGRYWGGNPKQFPRLKLGDDGGCFAHALAAVRQWGGGCWNTRRQVTHGARSTSILPRAMAAGSMLTSREAGRAASIKVPTGIRRAS